MTIQPYLFFEGRADEAVAFYQKVFGAEVQMLMRYKDSPDPCPEGMIPPGSEGKVMHMSLKIGDGVVIGVGRPLLGQARLSGFRAVLCREGRSGSGPRVRRPLRRRRCADAARQDVLFAALRHGGGPLRRHVDGDRSGLNADAGVGAEHHVRRTLGRRTTISASSRPRDNSTSQSSG